MEYNKINIDIFNDEQKYWFVRTNGGLYYDEYKTKGFIAFDINTVCDTKLLEVVDTNKVAREQLSKKIKEAYKNKTQNSTAYIPTVAEDTLLPEELKQTKKLKKDNIQTGLIINQLKRFMLEMKIGDIVLIPSSDSDKITFGKITSKYYIDKTSPLEGFPEEKKCPFFKRINVKWIKTIKKKNLDPYLYKVIYSHHSITDVSYARNYINRSLSDIYILNDKLYITFNVNRKTGIPVKNLLEFIGSFEKVAHSINLDQKYIDEIAQAEVKLNLQSPGPIQYIIGFAAGAFILAVTYATCNIADRGGTINIEHNNSKIELNVNAKTDDKYTITRTYEETTEKITSDNGEVKELKKNIEKLEITLPNEQKPSEELLQQIK